VNYNLELNHFTDNFFSIEQRAYIETKNLNSKRLQYAIKALDEGWLVTKTKGENLV
jgi:hypothetical protein